MSAITLNLLVQSDSGPPVLEEVRAIPLGGLRFEVHQSPGLVLGLAAGDFIELLPQDGSRFRVIKHGGNLCIQIFCSNVTKELISNCRDVCASLGGRLDGCAKKQVVLTMPVASGFPAIEAALNKLVSRHAGCEWYYGNVYDEVDGVTPLNWWTPG